LHTNLFKNKRSPTLFFTTSLKHFRSLYCTGHLKILRHLLQMFFCRTNKQTAMMQTG